MLCTDDGLGMAVFELAEHAVWIRMRDGFGICDFFLTGSALECCGGCDGPDMCQGSE